MKIRASGSAALAAGSYNIMAWQSAGAVGVVTDATARDTDEIATQKVPLYFRKPGRGIRPGRNVVESVNRPRSSSGACSSSRATSLSRTATASSSYPAHRRCR